MSLVCMRVLYIPIISSSVLFGTCWNFTFSELNRSVVRIQSAEKDNLALCTVPYVVYQREFDVCLKKTKFQLVTGMEMKYLRRRCTFGDESQNCEAQFEVIHSCVEIHIEVGSRYSSVSRGLRFVDARLLDRCAVNFTWDRLYVSTVDLSGWHVFISLCFLASATRFGCTGTRPTAEHDC